MQCGGGHWVSSDVYLPDWIGESWNELRRWLSISQPFFRHPSSCSAPEHSGHATPRLSLEGEADGLIAVTDPFCLVLALLAIFYCYMRVDTMQELFLVDETPGPSCGV